MKKAWKGMLCRVLGHPGRDVRRKDVDDLLAEVLGVFPREILCSRCGQEIEGIG